MISVCSGADPNISTTGSATSDITRLLKDSPFLERVTDMDMYYQNATDPNLAHPDFFAQVRPTAPGFDCVHSANSGT